MNIPHTPYDGLIARTATQCACPNSGETGSFLYSGDSHKEKGSRVTPVCADLCELYAYLRENRWESVGHNGAYVYHSLPDPYKFNIKFA